MHKALQSNASLATSIEGMRDTFVKSVADNSGNSSSKFVRRQSLDSKIEALEQRLTGAVSQKSAETAKSASKSGPGGKRVGNANTVSKKSAPKKKNKKAPTGSKKSLTKKKNSAFAVGNSDSEADDDDDDDEVFEPAGAEAGGMATIDAPITATSSKSKASRASTGAKKGKSKASASMAPPTSTTSGGSDGELDWLAMFDDAGGSSSNTFGSVPAPRPAKAKTTRSSTGASRKASKRAKPSRASESALKPSRKTNSVSAADSVSALGKCPPRNVVARLLHHCSPFLNVFVVLLV